MKPEIVLTYTNSSFVSVNITNHKEFFDKRYHTGYKLYYTKSYVNHEQIEAVTKYFNHGSNIILLEDGIEDFREYNFQILSLHNGGSSISYKESLTTFARGNLNFHSTDITMFQKFFLIINLNFIRYFIRLFYFTFLSYLFVIKEYKR